MSATLHQEPAAGTWLKIVRDKIESIRFGSVQIVVHDGRVTQVESTEKTRLSDAAPVAHASQKKTASS